MVQKIWGSFISKVLFVLCFAFFLNSSFLSAEMSEKADQEDILVIGTGKIVDGNVANARKIAISRALVRGVEQYLARRLGNQGMVNNFRKLIQEVIPRAREEIENFHILAEEQIDQDYKILVRLKVNEKMMEEELRSVGLILREGPPIKILFLVSQIEHQKRNFFYWWRDPESDSPLTPTELALYRIFEEHGFSPMRRLLNVPEGDYSPEMKMLDLSDEDAIKWGMLFSADVVIHGRCEIIEEKEISVILKILDVKKSAIISQDNQMEMIDEGIGNIEKILQTMETAINKLVVRVSPIIIKAMEVPETNTNQLEIALKGLRNFKQFRQLKEFIEKDIWGVKSVKQTKVKDNSIYILVEFIGDENRFLETLVNHGNLPFQIELTRMAEGGVIINVRH